MADGMDIVLFLLMRLDEQVTSVTKAGNAVAVMYHQPTAGLTVLASNGDVLFDLDERDLVAKPSEVIALAMYFINHMPGLLGEIFRAQLRIVEDIMAHDYVANPDESDGLSARVLRYLVRPWSSHPDYNPEWGEGIV